MTRFLLSLATTCVAFATGIVGAAETHAWQAGTDYLVLPTRAGSTSGSAKVEVIEAFSYTCVHCYRFESHLTDWLHRNAGHVEFVRIPSQWSAQHRAHARLYYTLQALGRNDLDRAVFEAIHVGHNRLYSADERETLALQRAFAEAHAIDGLVFTRTYNSPSVRSRLEEAERWYLRFKLENTPGIVIDGRYATDISRLLSKEDFKRPDFEELGFTRLLELTDHLVEIESHARQAAAANQHE